MGLNCFFPTAAFHSRTFLLFRNYSLREINRMKSRFKKAGPVLAVSSPGGHWRQLLQLSEAWEGKEVIFATCRQCDLDSAGVMGVTIPDASRSDLLAMAKLAAKSFWLIAKTRPSVVISTGAAPGLLSIFFGRLFGAKTVWVDSVANVERLSGSGRIASKMSAICLTQWRHLASPQGPVYMGGLL
jgi:UDP-N-acetylglucosamine:LPS N-acetylglucosamine transferase